ncbi:type II toxin-antitoxin system VapB family antitoxin [Kitasatospora kifunensis]|uniref:Arc/MetJ family transcription regulator n=1 Tax=Kitasatospora kifunensis TaxID=58351 RepID=A0A7W7VX44_KITKI|nr:type II toxin-antitoxin system VapB family antitoxin [Kitasatospora kifunensis]MBB4926202.1 Arc/MetJ family transcription regulator [Kitasatospora kifunensis]
MTRTVLGHDDDLLAEARRLFGTTTQVATVTTASLDAVKLARRTELADAIANGEFRLLDEPGAQAAV